MQAAWPARSRLGPGGGGVGRPRILRLGATPPEGHRAARGQEREHAVARAPQRGLPEPARALQVQARLHQGGIAHQGQHAPEVARRIQEVGIVRGGMAGVGEPLLQQRRGRAHHHERQPHRERDQGEHVEDRVGLASPQPARVDRERQHREGQADRDQVHEGLAGGAQAPSQQVRVGVAGEQRALEEHHARAPHRGSAAEQRQDHLADHRLHHEEKEGAGEERQRVQQQDGGQAPDPPVAAAGGGP